MSVGKRIFNIARAELKSAAGKLRDGAANLVGGREHEGEAEPARTSEEPVAREAPPRAAGGESAEVRRYYANLELPIGASLPEVKAAYRRLVRRYHPDRHQQNEERREAATRLARELRTAYEGLLRHLGGDDR